MIINNKEIYIRGKLIKIAGVVGEWEEIIDDPESFVKEFNSKKTGADIFTFWQLPPDNKPKYKYYFEWVPIAVIPIRDFDYWWKHQIKKNTRHAIKKSQRLNVETRMVDFDDDLVRGIQSIYNESPIRQGKPFWHYGKDFETVKREVGTYLEKSEFIGAFYENELIGFIKITYMPNFADPMQIIGKISHRDKSPVNALISKAIEICDQKKIPYFCYGDWSRGGLGDFKRNNGFEKFEIPRYYVPLSIKGRILVSLRLHHGLESVLPEEFIVWLIKKRGKYYLKKYSITRK